MRHIEFLDIGVVALSAEVKGAWPIGKSRRVFLVIDYMNVLIKCIYWRTNGICVVSCGTNLIVGILWRESYCWYSVPRSSLVFCGANLFGQPASQIRVAALVFLTSLMFGLGAKAH